MSTQSTLPAHVEPEPAADSNLLETFIDLCDALSMGRPADENRLFALTKDTLKQRSLARLAEAFGMMIVKLEARHLHHNLLIEELQQKNTELLSAYTALDERNAQLLGTLQSQYAPKRLLGHCPAVQAVVNLALTIARRPINTLICGATGTGKEVVAKTIHFNSPRCKGPFIAVNCTAIPDSLFESEMFGINKGIATGVSARMGLIEAADGGTLFLDELADMSLHNQAKLLRVLETREVIRVGSSKPIPVDIKIIAATNANLLEAMQKGRFREDLYYRINVAEIHLPPLCERDSDVLLLAQHFLGEHCRRMGRSHLEIDQWARACLQAYSWPGNVRELNNEMERVAALTQGNIVTTDDLAPRIKASLPKLMDSQPAPHLALPSENVTPPIQPEACLHLWEAEKRLIHQALERSKGNKSNAAKLLGITREGLRKKLLRMADEPSQQ